MKKQTWKMILSLALVVCMLAACGSNNGNTGNSGNQSGNQTSDGNTNTNDNSGDTGTAVETTLKVGLHGDTGGFDPQTGTSGTPPVRDQAHLPRPVQRC